MKIIISPAKIMKSEIVGVDCKSTPRFLNQSLLLWDYLKKQDDQSLLKIWDCNKEIALENKKRLQIYNLQDNLQPALLTYDGLQYKKMAANVFSNDMWDFIDDHLVILSGLYGYLRPLDGINPYRLMMGAKIKVNGFNNLYDFWGDKIYLQLIKDDKNILNLASKEYSDVISKYLTDDINFISVEFLSKNKKGDLVVKSTEAKSCRGAMVHFIALNHIDDFESIKKFNDFNYQFSEKLSDKHTFVFVKHQ